MTVRMTTRWRDKGRTIMIKREYVEVTAEECNLALAGEFKKPIKVQSKPGWWLFNQRVKCFLNETIFTPVVIATRVRNMKLMPHEVKIIKLLRRYRDANDERTELRLWDKICDLVAEGSEDEGIEINR